MFVDRYTLSVFLDLLNSSWSRVDCYHPVSLRLPAAILLLLSAEAFACFVADLGRFAAL